MQLFYSPDADANLKLLSLTDQEAHHVSKVLRMGEGDKLLVTNGKGDVFGGVIKSVGKRSVDVQVLGHRAISTGVGANITLAVGMLKARDRMEWLVEKAVEIGIRRFVCLQTSRTERTKIRTDRLEGIAVAAMKQSLQAWLPQVEVSDLDTMLQSIAKSDVSERPGLLVAHEQGEGLRLRSDLDLFTSDQNRGIILFVGPEGGFTDQEVQKIVNVGGISVSLGIHRLRTETAALTLLSQTHLLNNTDHVASLEFTKVLPELFGGGVGT